MPVRLIARRAENVLKEKRRLCVEVDESISITAFLGDTDYFANGKIRNSFFQENSSWIVDNFEEAGATVLDEIPPGEYVLVKMKNLESVFSEDITVCLKARNPEKATQEKRELRLKCGDSVNISITFEGIEYFAEGTIQKVIAQKESLWIVSDLDDAYEDNCDKIPSGEYVLVKMKHDRTVFFDINRDLVYAEE